MTTSCSIEEINGFDQETFVARFGGLFEGSPWIAAETWLTRPFADWAALERELRATIARATVERQVALIRAHPDLVGRAALVGALGQASTAEQAAAGIAPDRLTPDDVAAFTRLNQAYQERFAFPFVICARENRKESILAGFANRLEHGRDEEIETALAEIGKIGHYRLLDIVGDQTPDGGAR